MNEMNMSLAENLGEFLLSLTNEVVKGLQENMRAEMIIVETMM